jgi:hypothetical protein
MKTRTATAQVETQTPSRVAAQSPAPPLLVFPGGVFPGGAPLKTLQNASGLLSRAWRWFRDRQAARSNPRRLQVAATVSLGEKRFVSVIQVDGLQFLVGGGATNVSLLAQLKGNASFGDLLQETMTTPRKQPAKRVRQQIAKPAAEPGREQA